MEEKIKRKGSQIHFQQTEKKKKMMQSIFNQFTYLRAAPDFVVNMNVLLFEISTHSKLLHH